jgi:hypothetical protein
VRFAISDSRFTLSSVLFGTLTTNTKRLSLQVVVLSSIHISHGLNFDESDFMTLVSCGEVHEPGLDKITPLSAQPLAV